MLKIGVDSFSPFNDMTNTYGEKKSDRKVVGVIWMVKDATTKKNEEKKWIASNEYDTANAGRTKAP